MRATTFIQNPPVIMDFRAYEAAPGISVIVLPDAPVYTHVAVSNDLIRATGLKKEDVIGKGHFEVFPKSPNDPNFTGELNLKASFEYILQNKERHEIPVQRYDIPKEHGTFDQRYWKINNAPILGGDGEVLYIVHSAMDITEQVKAEQKVESAKVIEKTHNLFMSAPVIIGIVKGDNYIIELANDGMLQVWGRGKEVIGEPLLQAIPELKEQGFVELLDKVRITGEPYYAHQSPSTLIRGGTEEVRYFDFVYRPYFEDGTDAIATGVIGVAHDVTEQVLARKKVEEITERLNFRNALFEAQIEATPDGVLIVDAQGRVLLHNKHFVEIWAMPQVVIDSNDDEAALRHAMTMVVDPEGFMDRVKHLYGNHNDKSFDQILFRDGRVIERTGTPIIAENGYYYGWAWYFRDVTNRIKQEQKFSNVVEQAPDPILILKGEDMVLEVANDALLRLWNVDRRSIGKTFLEILPEMRGQGFLELLQKVYRTGEPLHGFEVPAVFKENNGETRTVYFNFTYQPYREVNGEITGVLVLATDVTGQVLVNRKLVESERNLRNTILQSPVAMCILYGSSFLVKVANDRMFNLWGKTAEDLMDKPIFEGLPEARNQGLEELLHQVYITGETFSAKERPVRLPRNGSLQTLYVNFVYQPFKEGDGKISGVIGVAFDVTEQVLARMKVEESEDRFRTFINSISQLAWMADAEGWIYWYNERWYEYTGTSFEEMQGWGWEKVHHPDHIDRILSFVKEAWKTDQPFELTFPLRGKDGEYRWFLTRAFPVKNKQGKVILWIGTNTDIHDQKQIEVVLEEKVRERTLELENLNNDLRRSNSNLEQFAFAASHDLKEPIRKILIFSGRIKGRLTDKMAEEDFRLFESLQQAGKRMGSLIDDLLAYSQATKVASELENIDLSLTVQHVLEDLELEVQQKQAEITVEPLPDLKGNRQQFQQLFHNLISNALKYNRSNATPKVHISSKAVCATEYPSHLLEKDPNKGYLLIQVKDNGIGFDKKDAERIFQVFTRLHGKSEYGGTGVGLAIVQKVVENHGGKIWAESEPDVGATFKVLLPVE